jgi:flagellar biosynthesis protein FlhG
VAAGIREDLSAVKLYLIINQARHEADRQLGQYMRSACRKYFSLEVDYLGHVPHDDRVWQSIRQRQPFLLTCSLSPAAQALAEIGDRLTDKGQFSLGWKSGPQEAAG